MKKKMLICFMCITMDFGFLTRCLGIMAVHPSYDVFSLSATTTWHEYSVHAPEVTFNKEKWAWTCSLTLRSKQPLKLSSIVLQWQGKQIKQLAAALYQKKERDSAVLPIQGNFICDGIWSPSHQQLIFAPDKKVVAVDNYYLVVSYPKEAESTIKHGKFVVADAQLSELVALHKE
ncbi:MAG: hypothetical protein WC365_02185 [Candidatus Babeliales bacterium]|jgi:hypothetical protein